MDGQSGDHVLLAPPYIATPCDIDMIVDRLGTAVDSAIRNINQ
jgi:adenosylmethionine-8-amino-7-oxononanoate aminotransferase